MSQFGKTGALNLKMKVIIIDCANLLSYPIHQSSMKIVSMNGILIHMKYQPIKGQFMTRKDFLK